MLQPENGKPSQQDFQEVKEWLKKYLRPSEMDDGLSKLVAAGSVDLENQAEVEAEAAGLSNAEPVPEPKPIEYVDASGLSNLLGSVLNF